MNISSRVILFLLFVQLGHSLLGQVRLQRQVLSSFGNASVIDSSIYLSQTVGQGIPVGTVFNDGFLRIGFEQPPKSNDCGIINSFVVEEMTTECGSFYSFEFTGSVVDELNYEWDFGPNAIPELSTEMRPMDVVFIGDEAQAIVRLKVTTADGCSSSSAMLINVNTDGFAAQTEVSAASCQEETIDVELLTVNGQGPFSYQWSDGDTSRMRSLPMGFYEYTITDNNGCITAGDLDLQNLSDVLDITANVTQANCDTTVLGSIEIEVSGGLSPLQYEWSNESMQQNLADVLPGNYILTVTDSRGCEAIEEFIVEAKCLDEEDIPNIITPNNDNVNDFWVLPNIDKYPNNELVIFNRWGSEIVEYAPYENQWAGNDEEGNNLPLGAYYYVLKLNDANDRTLSGSITIIR